MFRLVVFGAREAGCCRRLRDAALESNGAQPQTRTTVGMCAMCKCLKNPEWLGKPDAMTDVMVMVVVVVGVSWCHCRVLRTCGSRWSPFLSSRTRGCVLRDSGWEEGDLWGGGGGVGGWVRAIDSPWCCLSVCLSVCLYRPRWMPVRVEVGTVLRSHPHSPVEDSQLPR